MSSGFAGSEIRRMTVTTDWRVTDSVEFPNERSSRGARSSLISCGIDLVLTGDIHCRVKINLNEGGKPWRASATSLSRSQKMALAMWAARHCTGLTLKDIGAALDGFDYAAVAMAVRRLESRAPMKPLRPNSKR